MNAAEKAKLVDEFIQLEHHFQGIKGILDRRESVQRTLRGLAAGANPEREIVIEGSRGIVRLGPCALQRKIPDMLKAWKSLGQKRFLDIARVTLGDLERVAPELEAALVISDRTGPRNLSIEEKLGKAQ